MDSSALLSGTYLNKGGKTDKAIQGLKELYEFLGKHKQSEKPSDAKKLKKISGLLVQEHMLCSKDEKVQLYLSCCIAEIVRIHAPNAPYSEAELKDIFDLFLVTLDDIHLKKQSFCSNLLQQLVRVKAFLLIIDLDMQLVRDAFSQFLSIPIDDISIQDATNLQNILALCIQTMNEDDDVIDDDILQTILICLIPKPKKRGSGTVPHRSFPLAEKLILHCTTELQNSITRFLLDAIQRQGKGPTELYKYYHILITEINKISPPMLRSVLPHLEKELKHKDNAIRQRVIDTLAATLKTSPSLLTSNQALYDVFLSKHDDSTWEIRAKVIQTCKILFEYHPDTIPQVSEIFVERVTDVHEQVRIETIRVICAVAERNLSSVSATLLEHVANRLIDSKPDVRKAASNALSSLYNEVIDADFDEDELEEKINWIPKKIICCYHYPNWQVRYNVERVVSDDLLPVDDEGDDADDDDDDDIETVRAAVLLDIVLTFVDEPQVLAAHQKLLKEKIAFQKLFTRFLDDVTSGGMFDDVDDSLYTRIASHFPACPQIKTFMTNLSALTPEIIKEFRIMLNTNEIVEKKTEAKARALAIKMPFGLGKSLNPEEKEIFLALVEKINFTHITPSTIPRMFSHISSRLPKDSEEIPEEVEQLFSFLQGVAEIIPRYFSGCYLQLKAMLSDKNEFIVDSALSILSHTAHTLSKQAFSTDILNELKRLCENGTSKQAKCAVKSLAKIYKKDVKNFSKTFEELLEKLIVYMVGGSSDNFSTIICSLGCIAEVAPANFTSITEMFKTFILKTLFRDGSAFDWQTRMHGIRAIVKYALSLDVEVAKEEGAPIITFLVDILDTVAAVEEKEIDRSFLRKAAAVGLIKLATKSHYEAMISPQQFLVLARTARDPCFEVRSKILDHLGKGCKIAALRTRYLALMIMFAADPQRKIVKKLKEGFASCVTFLRNVVKQRAGKDRRIMLLNPEFALPFLMFLISHSFDFEKDAPDYSLSAKYLLAFIDQIKTSNNSSHLFHSFDWMRKANDVVNPEFSDRMYVLCEIGKAIIKSKSPRKWSETGKSFFLPPQYYQRIEDVDELKKKLSKKYLPHSFRVPTASAKRYHTLCYPGQEDDVLPYVIDAENAVVPKSIGAIISPKKPKTKKRRRAPAKAKSPATKKRKLNNSETPTRHSKRVAYSQSQVSYEEETSSSDLDDILEDLSSDEEE